VLVSYVGRCGGAAFVESAGFELVRLGRGRLPVGLEQGLVSHAVRGLKWGEGGGREGERESERERARGKERHQALLLREKGSRQMDRQTDSVREMNRHSRAREAGRQRSRAGNSI
jgi:hypothetical protein